MREILFRGKRMDNGEWVYGSYGDYMSLGAMIIDKPYPGCDGGLSAVGFWVVRSDTVGQYTGLNDKNGTKIFEGDILRVSKYGETYLSKIVFNEKTAGFEFWWKFICGEYGELATGKYNMAQFEDIEVIGNIYDTPELLGVEK